MEKYKFIILDDEYPSHLIVKHHLKTHHRYECVHTFFSPAEALFFLQEHDIDLIFLDIEMPEMNGFQFLEALKEDIFVVILTAFEERYALEAHQYYDKDLVFFTNKSQLSYYMPKILARFEKMFDEKKMLNRVTQLFKNEIHTFPKKFKNNEILLSDIIHIKIFGHNAAIKLKNGEEVIQRMTTNELLDILPANLFFQISRNTIINIVYVTSFTKSSVSIDNEHITITSRNRKTTIPAIKMLWDQIHRR